jgi:hypothetical protein
MKVKFHELLIIVGFVIWLAETAYFGFNLEPINNIERSLDSFSVAIILSGLILSITTNLTKPTNLTVNFDKDFIELIKKYHK